MTVLSSSVSAPSVVSSISFPSSTDRSRTSLLNRLNVVPIGSIRMLIALSRSSQVSRSTSSAMATSSVSFLRSAIWLKRAWTVTSSPTRFTSRSSFSDGHADAPRRFRGLALLAALLDELLLE